MHGCIGITQNSMGGLTRGLLCTYVYRCVHLIHGADVYATWCAIVGCAWWKLLSCYVQLQSPLVCYFLYNGKQYAWAHAGWMQFVDCEQWLLAQDWRSTSIKKCSRYYSWIIPSVFFFLYLLFVSLVSTPASMLRCEYYVATQLYSSKN